MADVARTFRCAIYTRKSTEEGLEKDFNSLDAQRDACAAYVLSQLHEGWKLLPDLYDDGGYSGGNMERPALRQLLDDVKAGRIDVVVVYKIDRLTRSLTDFAKIVEVLDAAETSFVSVTQAFNTTNSMGRLTLNVLLSFAQFEREVIAERIRDKIAASKARGMWMGGTVPLGYEVKDRKLVVVPEEAETVRQIMERYVRSNSVRELLVELQQDGIITKRRIGKNGRERGGIPFKRGALYGLLANRTYVGVTSYQGKTYPGEHEAIVSSELFDAVQARLAERTNPRSPRCSRKPVSLLAGMIVDHVGRPMSPVHTKNHGRRYTYYASNLNDDASTPAQRLPAGELEAAVRKAIADWLKVSCNTRALKPDLETIALAGLIERCRAKGMELTSTSLVEARLFLQSLQVRVRVAPDFVTASIDASALLASVGVASSDARRIEFTIETFTAAYGHEPRLRLEPPSGIRTQRDERLIDLIVRAHVVRDELLAMSDEDVAAIPATRLRHLERVARLSYLDPKIVTAILDGTQPRSLSARKLSRMAALPLSWAEQRKVLGFNPA
ncbi:MAG: recombinase family protein [Novosphingobium sp.]